MTDRFRPIADVLPEPMLVVCPDGRIESANVAFTHAFGWAEGDLARVPLLELLHGDAGGLESYLRQCAASQHMLPGRLEVRNRDGSVVTCRVEGGLFRPASAGEPALVLVRLTPEQQAGARFAALTHKINELGVEIVKRRAAEDAAEAALDRQRRLIDRLGLLADAGAAFATSLDYEETLSTIVHLAVPAVADWCAVDILLDDGRLRRLAVAHIRSARIEFDQTPADDPEDSSPIGQVIARRVPIVFDELSPGLVRTLARDDQHHETLFELGLACAMCVPLVVHGRSLGALTFGLARARRRYNRGDLRFAQEVALRAALAVENARVYEDARRANRHKDDFLATLSHELRTPLNAVLGYTRMLRTGAVPPDKLTTALDTIDRNAAALRQLVEDVFDVSRIEAGKIRLNIRAVNLGSVLRAVAATMLPAAETKGVRLDVILNPSVPAVPGDGDRIQQIVCNLVANAVKFTSRGGRVQLQLSQSGTHAEIEVSDTGAGIPASVLPYIFERFRQAHSHFEVDHGGLGLGLAISRHLAELHGGSIGAESAGPGRGATFVVTLPLVRPAVEPVLDRLAEVHELPPSDEGRAGVLAGLRVLVVDDDADALALVRRILEAAGAHVSTASSGGHAIEVLEGGAPAVLVIDIGLPVMDGFELIAQVRSFTDPKVSGLPAIALTAQAGSSDRAAVVQRGFQEQVRKPINPADLTSAVFALARRTTHAR